jgi:hypothetical protein
LLAVSPRVLCASPPQATLAAMVARQINERDRRKQQVIVGRNVVEKSDLRHAAYS